MNVMLPRVLIFVSKTGGGHISLAQALQDRLEPQYSVEMVDPQPAVIHTHYRLLSRHALWLWAAEFRFSDHPARALAAHKTFTALVGRRVRAVLRASQPDLVITTYPFLTYEVTRSLQRLHLRTPFVMLQADPNGVHQTWLSERGADAVFCPTRETHTQTLAAGFKPERVHLTGWPVRGQFYKAHMPRAQMLQSLGLRPDRFTIFLQGGGEGAAKFVRTVETILEIEDSQVILAAGTNHALLQRFSGVRRGQLVALPFIREIAPYMAAADVVMGKAGPNMLFEAVTLGKPFIATSYIPGQEEVNLEFIQRHQLGWVALDGNSQTELIRRLIGDASALKAMEGCVDVYRRWNTSVNEAIVPVIQTLIGR
jgi:UDP-N-acetylglucosamine:LPS N-acetylglucosamine transferase